MRRRSPLRTLDPFPARLLGISVVVGLFACSPDRDSEGATNDPGGSRTAPQGGAVEGATDDPGDARTAPQGGAAEGRQDVEETEAPGRAAPVELPRRELVRADLEIGKGAAARKGDQVAVYYTASLLDGSTVVGAQRREPYRFQLGDEAVIRGLSEGLEGMKVGGRRKLVIPSRLAYGQRGVKDRENGEYEIPPGAALVCEVELAEVRAQP